MFGCWYLLKVATGIENSIYPVSSIYILRTYGFYLLQSPQGKPLANLFPLTSGSVWCNVFSEFINIIYIFVLREFKQLFDAFFTHLLNPNWFNAYSSICVFIFKFYCVLFVYKSTCICANWHTRSANIHLETLLHHITC